MAPPLFQSFAINANGRDFAVGDIHGCFEELELALDRLGFDRDVDRLFSVGDLIDRGHQSDRLAEFLDAPWFFAVRGNHDQMMLDAHVSERWRSDWLANGGVWSFAFTPTELALWRDRIDALPLALEVATEGGMVGMVHANPMSATWTEVKDRLSALSALPRPFHIWDAEALATGMLWSRTLVNDMAIAHEENIPMAPFPQLRALVIGHTVVSRPLNVANIWAIDTGACYGYPDSALTLLELKDLSLTQLPLPGAPTAR